MKQLLSLFLLLLPCLAWAQYPSNGNQKITLGEQTTADGLVYRGVLADTGIITPSSDTSAYIILDTANHRFYNYNRATNVWSVAGGTSASVSGTSGQVAYFDATTSVTGDAGLIYSAANKTLGINTTTTSGANLIIKNSQEPARTTFLASQTFGADTTNWTRGTGWTFNGTLAVATAATGDLTYTTLPDTIISGRAYEITYTQSGYSSGTATIALGNVTLAIPKYNVTTNIILLLPTSATGGFRITTSTYTGNLDNISIVEITGTAPVIFAGQDDGSATLYNSLRMPTTTTLAFGGGGARTTGVGNNVFIGNNAGSTNTTGSNNYFFGPSAGLSNTSGSNNVFIGLNAGQFNTIGVNNNFFGSNSGNANTTGSNNNFFGNSAGSANTTGSNNFMFGTEAGQFNTTGSTNIFFGVASGRNNISGTNNIFFGSSSGRNSKSTYNIAIGDNALHNSTAADTLTGNSNIAIGLNAADNIKGAAAGNLVIGNGVGGGIDLPDPSGSNQVVIKNIIFATGASGTGTTIAGSVGIGTNAPTSRLHVKGVDGTSSNSSLNVTNSSDASLLFVRNDGNVGIGTASPTFKLDVSGTFRATGAATFSSSVAANSLSLTTPLPVASGGTGSATKNFVDLTTTQTVAGGKTFTSNIQAQGLGFYSINSAFGQPKIEIPELSDLFWRADKRFTLTGFPGNPAIPFGGSFATDYQLPLNTVTTMNINVAGQEGIPVNGMTYGEGHLYISFYSSANNYDSISVSVKRSGVWTKSAEPINLAISGGYKVLRFIIGQGTNLTDFEIKIGVGSSNVWISSINFISNRYGGQELPFVSKYSSDNNLFGLLNMRTNTGADNVILSGTGNSVIGLVAGNLGVGIAAPTAKLHLDTGTTTVAPLKFTSGANLTTPSAGSMEFNGTNLFFTPSTVRHTVNYGLTGSATLDFPSTLTNLSADLTITVTGAADGDVVSLGVQNAAVNANTSYSAWVSAANTVTVRFNNFSSGTVNPASALFKVFVTK